jgi:hypothetical protein
MADKSEKERRKEILNNLRTKAKQDFEDSLPTSRDNFKQLFDYLDFELEKRECDDTNGLTKTFFNQIKLDNSDIILEWLAEKGGYCDCEILANVEEQFE